MLHDRGVITPFFCAQARALRPLPAQFLLRTTLVVAIAMAPSLSFANTVLVSGQVTEHLTGGALDAIRIDIWSETSPFNEEEIASTVTVADGTYTWSGSCPWYCRASIDDERYLFASVGFYGSSSEVTAKFSLIQPATIAGSITVDGVTPAANIGVSASYYSESEQGWEFPMSTYEEGSGHYVISQLPPSVSYRVCAGGLDTGTIEQCFDHHNRVSLTESPTFDLVPAAEGEWRDGIDFDLASGGSISGTLHDGYLGIPLAGTPIKMTYFDQTGVTAAVSSTISDAGGHYQFKGLPDGSFYAEASIGGSNSPFMDANQLYPGIVCTGPACVPVTNGQPLTISGGSSLTSIDFTIHPAIVIKGRVTDATDGHGLGNVPIQTTNDFVPSAITAEDGEYLFYKNDLGMPFKIYTRGAQPHIDQVYPGIPCIYHSCAQTGQTFNPTRGSVVEHINFALQAGAAISGTIYDATTGLPRAGIIEVYDHDFSIVWSASVSASGAYTSGAWYPGTYYVKAFGYVGALFDCAFYAARPCPADNQDPATVMPTPVTMDAGEIRSSVDFHLDADTIFRGSFDP